MKRLLSLLLCFVFLNAQSFAKHEMPSSFSTKITGIYGGVLVPQSVTDGSGNPLPNGSNSLGLFSFTMPDSGYGAGAMLIFDSGRVFSGTITAIGNQNNLEINAILQATYDYTLSFVDGSGNLQSTAVTASSNGNMKATVDGSNTLFLPTLTGNATMELSQGEIGPDLNPVINTITKYTVDGVQQTSSVNFMASQGVTLPSTTTTSPITTGT